MKARCGLVFFALFALSACTTTKPALTHVDVFSSGQEGYHTYRIPAIETAPDGTIIVVTEARKYNRHDPGMHGNDIDLVMKRSTDGGVTWSKLVVLDDPGEKWSACNPTTMVDRTNGRVWLFNCRTKPDRSSATARPETDDSTAWTRYSDDNGVTWSTPRDITKVARDDSWGSCFYGPGGAIQDSKGRLIVPLHKITGGRDERWWAYVISSDDHGETWQRAELSPELNGKSENQLIEIVDGRVMMDARQRDEPHRYVLTTNDVGRTWSTARNGAGVTPVACAIERYTLTSAGDDKDRIVWTGPKGPGRSQLVVRVSYDEGNTYPRERLISPEKAAYSDLTILQDNSVGVIWERGGYQHITFSNFGREFLEGSGQKD